MGQPGAFQAGIALAVQLLNQRLVGSVFTGRASIQFLEFVQAVPVDQELDERGAFQVGYLVLEIIEGAGPQIGQRDIVVGGGQHRRPFVDGFSAVVTTAGPHRQAFDQYAVRAAAVLFGLEQVLRQRVGAFVGKVGPGLDAGIVAVQVRDELDLVAVGGATLPEHARYEVDVHRAVELQIEDARGTGQRLLGQGADLEAVTLGGAARHVVEAVVARFGDGPRKVKGRRFGGGGDDKGL